MRPRFVWTVPTVVALAVPFVCLLVAVSEAAERASSMGGLFAIWLCAGAGIELCRAPSSAPLRAASAGLASLCIATLANGAAFKPMWLLAVVLLLVGAAQLLDIPLVHCTSLPEKLPMPEIILTDVDLQRLTAMLNGLHQRTELAEVLEAEIARAQVVASSVVPRDVVTMNSRVVFEELETHTSHEASIVYPHDANAAEGRISVLAPVGSALLGLRVGQTIEWPLPRGRRKSFRVLEIAYQPEAAGHFHR